MALIGSREDWEALVRRNGAGAGLPFEHVRVVQRALTAADGATDVVVDALAAQTKHERAMARKEPLRAEYAVCRADDVEALWLDRAHEIGLTSIRPIQHAGYGRTSIRIDNGEGFPPMRGRLLSSS